ncbi:MAG: YIP1 family protein, partial [Thiobacillaceae bacterium]|nr:YIP1 family protein [Thiobacillaceae bacterium]
MKLSALHQLPLSADRGWPDIERLHPRLVRVFAFIVLPLSLLPPIMLQYVGHAYPEVFLPQAADKDWNLIAALFFLAEAATVLGMGWFIRQVAGTQGLHIDYHDAYLLAGIAPIPLWLSSLGLLVPNLAFNVVLSLGALGLSCGIIYHGVEALCHTREDVTAAGIVQIV